MKHKIISSNTDDYFEALEGQSLVESSLKGEGRLPHGCCKGQCGSCVIQVVSGECSYLYGYEPKGVLTSGQQSGGWVVGCMVEPKSSLVIKIPNSSRKPAEPKREAGVVISKEFLTEDVLRLSIRLSCRQMFDFIPGQYVDVILSNGQTRPYSLSSLPNADSVIELIIRHVKGGYFSNMAFNELKVGDVMQLEGPKGDFYWRNEHRKPIILVAGGTGIAPIQGIIDEILLCNPESDIHLYWSSLNEHSFYLEQKIEEWLRRAPSMKYTPVVVKPTDSWNGRAGSSIRAVVTDYPDLSAIDIYIAGAPSMVKEGLDTFLAFGLPEQQLYTDSFNHVAPSGQKKGLAAMFKRIFLRNANA